MSQVEDRPSPCSIYKENFDKKLKILGLNDCSLRGPPSGWSPQEAGGTTQTELHSPPPLPHDSRGCDHRHRARAVMTQTGSFKISLVSCILASFLRELTQKTFQVCLTLGLQPRQGMTVSKDFSFKV